MDGLDKWSLEQSQISLRIIEQLKPKIIVVISAFASDVMRKHFLKSPFDNLRGCYLYNDIPMLLTGMLTGRHPMDKGSREMLGWHIKRLTAN
jgi:hypothetical protein